LHTTRRLRREQAFLRIVQLALQRRRRPRVMNPDYIRPPLPYNEAYWKRCLSYGNEQFKRHFRMTRDSFDRLYDELYVGQPQQVNAFDDQFRLGLFLFRMATKMGCRELSEQFSVAQSSVSRITNEVAHEVVQRLNARYIRFPTTLQELFTISQGWEAKSGFPHVIGAIDGTHIDLDRCPVENGVSYYSRKQRYGIAMQGVVNHLGIFTSVDIGWPASVHDWRIFENSDFSVYMEEFIGKERKDHPSHRWYVLGDSAYQQSMWMMQPYSQAEEIVGSFERSFNIAHAKARVEVENAFGRFKVRWRRMQCLDTTDVVTGCEWIHACVVLHNFCELRNDQLPNECVELVMRKVEAEYEAEAELFKNDKTAQRLCKTFEGSQIRDVLAQQLHAKYLGRQEEYEGDEDVSDSECQSDGCGTV
jgi:hypothetical protein